MNLLQVPHLSLPPHMINIKKHRQLSFVSHFQWGKKKNKNPPTLLVLVPFCFVLFAFNSCSHECISLDGISI